MKEQKYLLRYSKQTHRLLKLTLKMAIIVILNMIYQLIFIRNKIGDEGAKAIAEALKTNTSLTEIDLRCSNNNHFNNTILLLCYLRQ